MRFVKRKSNWLLVLSLIILCGCTAKPTENGTNKSLDNTVGHADTPPVTTKTVNLNENTTTVPKPKGVCDLSYDSTLKFAGLKAESIEIQGPSDQDAPDIGCAYRIEPKPGTEVKKGSTVRYRRWYEQEG